MKTNTMKKCFFCCLLGSLVFLPGCSIGNLLPWNSPTGFLQQLFAPWAAEPVEPEVPYPDDSVDLTDPAISWIVYPGSQLYSDTLSIKLCKEAEDISYSWMEEPGLMLDPKYGHCLGMTGKNPEHSTQSLPTNMVLVRYYTEEIATKPIADWFVKEMGKKGWILKEDPTPIPKSCDQAQEPYELEFKRKREDVWRDWVRISISPYCVCGREGIEEEYFGLGTLIYVDLMEKLLTP